jgi:hypothetical protein
MLDNNKYNKSQCGFGEQTIAFLYGEIESSEKSDFEAHLESCATCVEEIAGFSAARFSILEWRNEEFLPLETPLIEIPFEKTPAFYNSEKDVEISVSWLNELKKLFTPSAALTASATFALIICCFGIVFFAIKPSNKIEIADVNLQKAEKAVAVEPINKTTENIDYGNEILDETSKMNLAKSPGEIDKENNRRNISQTLPARNISVVKNAANNKIVVNNSFQPANQQKIKMSNIENKKPLFARNGNVPRLNNVEEEEDKSLRLAELLDDGSTR